MRTAPGRWGHAHRWCIRLTFAAACAMLLVCTLFAGTARAFEPMPLSAELRAEALRAADKAPDVRVRKALRDGPYRVEYVKAFQIDGVPLVAGAAGQDTVVEILYRSGDGTAALLARYFPTSKRVEAEGQALFVMPGRQSPVEVATSKEWFWIASAIALGVLMLGGGLRRRAALLALPFGVIALLFYVQMQNVIPSSAIRSGNALLAGGFVLALACCAVAGLWNLRREGAPDGRARPLLRLPVSALVVLLIAGVACTSYVTIRMDKPIDVAFASAVGSDLMVGGALVYGSTDHIPGVISDADTYGPVAYLAYVPAALLRDDVGGVALTSNIVMFVLLLGASVALGRRVGGWRRGLWCGAIVAWYPPLTLGVAAGNNDIIGAMLVGFLLLALQSPVYRAALAVAAGFTKYIPLLLLVLVLRHRGESKAAFVRAAASIVVTTLVILVIGVHDLDGLRVFVERVHHVQLNRDDIGSFWGLSGLHEVRYVFLVASVTTALYGGWLAWRRGASTVPHTALAGCAFAFAGLPQFFAPYVSVLVPFALAVMIVPRPDAPLLEPKQPDDAGRADAELANA